MKNLRRCSEILNEIVYLFKTMFSDYEFVAMRPDPNKKHDYGYANLRVNLKEGDEIVLLIQVHGVPEDEELKFDVYSTQIPVDDYMFDKILTDVLYIFNKNKLDYRFGIQKMVSDVDLKIHAIVWVNKPMDIEKLEQVVNTTKVVNAKVKDTGDTDKMIYQTIHKKKDS